MFKCRLSKLLPVFNFVRENETALDLKYSLIILQIDEDIHESNSKKSVYFFLLMNKTWKKRTQYNDQRNTVTEWNLHRQSSGMA